MHNTINSGQLRTTSLLFLPFNCLASLDPLLYLLLPDLSWVHQVNRDGEREGGAMTRGEVAVGGRRGCGRQVTVVGRRGFGWQVTGQGRGLPALRAAM